MNNPKAIKVFKNFDPQSYAPAIALFILSPLVAEILLGSTPISRVAGLLPIVMLYGGGAVFIRELARRHGGGWFEIMLLAAAYALIEEGLVMQTLFNPILFNIGTLGGRAVGVNWVYSEWVIGYHIVWSISIPILLTEMLFPAHRIRPWLGRIDVTVFSAVYVLGALALAFFFRNFIAPGFQAPVIDVIGVVALIAILVVLGIKWPPSRHDDSHVTPDTRTPLPWTVGATSFFAASLWLGLLHLPGFLRKEPFSLIPMLLGIVLAAGSIVVIRQWFRTGSSWTDVHRLALAFGALMASMLDGFFLVTAGNHLDQIGQGVISLIAIGMLSFFYWKLQKGEKMTNNKVMKGSSKAYKGLPMEGMIATWYSKTTLKDLKRHKLMAKQLFEKIPVNGKVLEVAPGPGYFCIELAKLGNYQITGLDISKSFVEIARRNALDAGFKIDFRLGSASEMPFADETFDFIFCQAAFKNFSEPVKAIAEMYRVLQPGRTAVIVDMRSDTSPEELEQEVKGMRLDYINEALTRWTFKHMLVKSAYSIAEIESMIAQTPFGKGRIETSGIGFQVWLKK